MRPSIHRASTNRRDAGKICFPRLSVCLLLFCLGGCGSAPRGNTEAVYQQASTDFLLQRWSAAASGFQTVRRRARGERRGEAAYWEGQSHAAMGDHARAEARLREVATMPVSSALQSQAALALARVRMEQGRYRAALEQLQSLQHRRPGLDPAEVLALRAACQRSLKDHGGLSATLKELAAMESPFARQAIKAHAAAFSHVVQAGVYSKEALAQGQRRKLIAAGFRTYIKKKNDLYVVQTGVYRNRATAEQEVAKLKQRGFDAIITSTD